MTPPPENSEDNSWQKLDSLIEIESSGNGKPLLEYISQNGSNPAWREGAIEYLIKTCGHVWERTAMGKIWTIFMLTGSGDYKGPEALIAFFEVKWEELCGMKIKPEPANKSVRSINAASGHWLLGILAHVHNKKAMEYLEQILAVCQSNKNDDFAFAAEQSLTLARKFIRAKEAGGS